MVSWPNRLSWLNHHTRLWIPTYAVQAHLTLSKFSCTNTSGYIAAVVICEYKESSSSRQTNPCTCPLLGISHTDLFMRKWWWWWYSMNWHACALTADTHIHLKTSPLKFPRKLMECQRLPAGFIRKTCIHRIPPVGIPVLGECGQNAFRFKGGSEVGGVPHPHILYSQTLCLMKISIVHAAWQSKSDG